MDEDDIKVTGDSGDVCFHSAWDIGSSANVTLTAHPLPLNATQNKYCFTPQFHQICTTLSVSFSSGNCSLPFVRTKNITASEFLNANGIKPKPPTGLPAVLNVTLPEACTHLKTDYTCREGSVGVNKTELKPYTDYSCVGNIETEDGSIKTTDKVNFQIDCGLKILTFGNETTNTSIRLDWKVENETCKGLQLTSTNFSHECSCGSEGKSLLKKTGDGNKKSCDLFGAETYTKYNCDVQLKYNNKNVLEEAGKYTIQTKEGTPNKPSDLEIDFSENNKITVNCKYSHRPKGPKKKFRAFLYKSGTQKPKTHEQRDRCHFEFADLSYLTSYTVEVVLFNGALSSAALGKEIRTAYNDKAVIGFLVFLIILVSVALLFVVYKIFILKRGNSRDSSENLRLISTSQPDEKLMAVEPITSEVLLETYKRKLADEARLFLAEFQSIPRFFVRYSMKEAKKQHNSPRNRYVDILPYDYNRVQLTTGNGEAGCDYINASFIDGYKESKKYIAAQGPKEETVSDFWRMVWEQQSSIIVMVTRCEEGNKIKCAQYWPSPERETEIYEEFIVKLSSEDHCPDYTVRHLSVTNKREKNSEREVTHIQFMSWPDHGVPEEAQLLLKLRRRVNAFKNFFSGPIVVHCSAGVGRTGTYIGIDAMMEGLEAEGRVDIYGYVVRLRRQRCLMVQVEAQYILIHQALLEHNQFGETEIPLSELHSTLSTLRSKVSPSEVSLMEEEFERLPSYKNWRTHNAGTTEENRQRNRSSSVIPYDYNRVLLKLDEGHSQDSSHDYEDDEEDESSDEEDDGPTKYINASHINGYWGPHAFITAQTPLPGTMADFWSMVYQKRASAVVMLSDCEEGDEDCVYWGTDKKTFGDFEVEVTSTETSPAFTSRTMIIRHSKRKESRQVKHFQFLKWSSGELPEKPQDLTDLIKEVKRSSSGNGNPRAMTTVVHCNNGSSRSGIFCALWKVLDSAEREKLVDVFQVVKTLRKERQGMLSSPEQYQFLYDALESTFPVQNGEVKAVKSSAADSVQLVNETKAAEQPVEEMAASTTRNSQQGEAEGAPAAPEGGQEKQIEEPNVSTGNGPTVTAEV